MHVCAPAAAPVVDSGGYISGGRAVPRSLEVGGQAIGNGENKRAKHANKGGLGACSPRKFFISNILRWFLVQSGK